MPGGIFSVILGSRYDETCSFRDLENRWHKMISSASDVVTVAFLVLWEEKGQSKTTGVQLQVIIDVKETRQLFLMFVLPFVSFPGDVLLK